MRRSLRTYAPYSIGRAIVWAVLLIAGTLAGNGSGSIPTPDSSVG